MAITRLKPTGVNSASTFTFATLTSTGLITATGGGVKVGNIQDTSGTNTISLASGNVSMIGNLTVGTSGTGNVTATYFIGNGSQLTSVAATTAGTVTTAAQPNITSVGTLSGLTVGGTGFTTLQQSTELLQAPSFADPLTANLQSGTTLYVTPTANFTLNATNVPTTDNRTIIIVVILAQSTTGYYPNVFQIDGVGQTINWSGGTAPTANANKKDVASFTLIRTGAAWTVLGQYGTFG